MRCMAGNRKNVGDLSGKAVSTVVTSGGASVCSLVNVNGVEGGCPPRASARGAIVRAIVNSVVDTCPSRDCKVVFKSRNSK